MDPVPNTAVSDRTSTCRNFLPLGRPPQQKPHTTSRPLPASPHPTAAPHSWSFRTQGKKSTPGHSDPPPVRPGAFDICRRPQDLRIKAYCLIIMSKNKVTPPMPSNVYSGTGGGSTKYRALYSEISIIFLNQHPCVFGKQTAQHPFYQIYSVSDSWSGVLGRLTACTHCPRNRPQCDQSP